MAAEEKQLCKEAAEKKAANKSKYANPHLSKYARWFDECKDHLFLRQFFTDIDDGMQIEFYSAKTNEKGYKTFWTKKYSRPDESPTNNPNNTASTIKATKYL
ncbi:uncharacterized protein CC84DRAFT_1223731 [Paraphaeosphaeria sporulosa]|uniref:Uncharacterized protein n=1 Tax=Paraphaeosphaeria sporulosa TaxID=1460663 RepID=A0A177BV35_9PLEO|nr:uncharacterized protein CC84DRAFT_1223731 [Paraphaeosphaeria sporulosa]OAF98518.1 hypothetical protein CC84DRAFT_1223731 [Paraphaeosphaeria sporulosa]